MSHVITSEADNADQQIVSIPALQAACQRAGLVFKEGQQTYRTWASDHGGRLVSDYPIPAGYTAEEVGRSDHAIGLNNKATSGPAAYEIGVVPSKKHPGTYSLMYDFYGGNIDRVASSSSHVHDLGKLMAFYHAEAAREAALNCGDTYSEQLLDDGTILVESDTSVRMGV